jgi:hypothetical protein
VLPKREQKEIRRGEKRGSFSPETTGNEDDDSSDILRTEQRYSATAGQKKGTRRVARPAKSATVTNNNKVLIKQPAKERTDAQEEREGDRRREREREKEKDCLIPQVE